MHVIPGGVGSNSSRCEFFQSCLLKRRLHQASPLIAFGTCKTGKPSPTDLDILRRKLYFMLQNRPQAMFHPCARAVQTSTSCLHKAQAFLEPKGRQSVLAKTFNSRAHSSHSSQGVLRRSSLLRKLLQGSSILLAASTFQTNFVSMSAAAESKAAQARFVTSQALTICS